MQQVTSDWTICVNYLIPAYSNVNYVNTLDKSWECASRHNQGSNLTFCDGHAKYYKFGTGPLEIYGGYDFGNESKWWNPAKQ